MFLSLVRAGTWVDTWSSRCSTRGTVSRRGSATHGDWSLAALFICDGSVMPEVAEKNLTLTIMALADRLASHLRQAG